MRGIERKWAVLVVVSMFVLAPAAASAQQQGSETELKAGLEAGFALFKSLRGFWKEEIVDPLARTQATRSLRQLSNALDDLAVQKEEFGEAVSTAAARNDFDRLLQDADELRETVSQLRRRLGKFFRTLPARRQAEAGRVEEQLHIGFSTKLESINAVAQELALAEPSVAAAKSQTANMVKLTLAMKAQVDSLMADIQKEIAK